jgi:hypothetical protein
MDAMYPFSGHEEKITKLTVENGVTLISYCAFEGLYNLKEVSIADSVTDIIRMAFRNTLTQSFCTMPWGHVWRKLKTGMCLTPTPENAPS